MTNTLLSKRYIHNAMPILMHGKAYIQSPSDPRIPAVLGAEVLGVPLQQVSDATVMENERDGVSNDSKDHRFPLVVYSHGLGGMRCDNSATCCDLASHGYLVAAVEHR